MHRQEEEEYILHGLGNYMNMKITTAIICFCLTKSYTTLRWFSRKCFPGTRLPSYGGVSVLSLWLKKWIESKQNMKMEETELWNEVTKKKYCTCRDGDSVPVASRVCINWAIAAENASYGAPMQHRNYTSVNEHWTTDTNIIIITTETKMVLTAQHK